MDAGRHPKQFDRDEAPAWYLRQVGGETVLVVKGSWLGQLGGLPEFRSGDLRDFGGPFGFDTRDLGRWDSGLIAFLWDAIRAATSSGLKIDGSSLPDAIRKLLDLLPGEVAEPPKPKRSAFRPFYWLGGEVIDTLTEIGALSDLTAQISGGCVRAALGRAMLRPVDLFSNTRSAGPSALTIVSVVNFLVGAILAFVGAVQLRRFAADIFVADLVGLAVVREMAAVMTGIIMAGRTGGAYAARIATMRGNEELDALEVVGIPVSDYLILPSVLSLAITMPVLYLYGCLVGILGGFLVAISMLNITALGYYQQTLGAVPFDQFAFGFVKTLAFGLMIGLVSCRIGLLAGRSAADVGIAATRAVVAGIVGVIAMDAIFAVLADAIGV
jgi:phospholipid/cholesterol/gamma-HCH transport system permease protein